MGCKSTSSGYQCILADGHEGPHADKSIREIARREGVIEGLERALRKVEEVGHLEAAASVSGLIEAEIERLRRGE